MKVRRSTMSLAVVLAVLVGGAAFLMLRGTPTLAPVVLAPATESSGTRVKREALDAMGPGRMLGKAASTAPESVVLSPPPAHAALPATRTTAASAPHVAPPAHSGKLALRTPEAAIATVPGAEDGAVTTVAVTTPPFEVARRYRSMEGPFAEYRVRLDGTDGVSKPGPPRQLLWWKGAKIEMLDETGAPLDQELMCHLNIDVDTSFRTETLGRAPHTTRLLTLTQGQLAFVLPKGRGLPVASDETWSLMFQVLNHNRDGAFRVKQRLTLYFVRDVDLFQPIDPVAFEAASLWVPVDKSSPDALRFDKEACHCCTPLGRALEAPNNIAGARRADDLGRAFVAHWTVPPGTSTWTYPFKRSATAFDPVGKRLFAMWTHVHPFATQARLSVIAPGCEPVVVARAAVESRRDGKTGLVRIEPIADPEGLPLPTNGDYEMAVDYDNTSGIGQDSMTSFGLFLNDDGWKRPAWADRAQNKSGIDESCASP